MCDIGGRFTINSYIVEVKVTTMAKKHMWCVFKSRSFIQSESQILFLLFSHVYYMFVVIELNTFVNIKYAMQNTHPQFCIIDITFQSTRDFICVIHKENHKPLSCFDTSCTYICVWYNLQCFIGVVEGWLQLFLFRYLYRCCIFSNHMRQYTICPI